MDILNWLIDWYQKNCDGDWEHENQIKIYTLSNPGWSITIDLADTPLESFETDFVRVENGETDWYDYHFHEGKFSAGGDPTKLVFLLSKFREVAEKGACVNE